MVSGDGRRDAPEDYERIDITQWRPSDQPIITPERAAKGDILVERDPPTKRQQERGEPGNVRFAQAHVQNILNWLYEQDKLTDQHVYDGQTYEIWQHIYQSRRAMRRKDPLFSIPGFEEQEATSERGFTLILLRMPIRHQRAVESAIHTYATGQARFLARKNLRHFVDAFESLSSLLPPIHDELKRLREAAKNQAAKEAEIEEKLRALAYEKTTCAKHKSMEY
mgnify:CR=1 FL=1